MDSTRCTNRNISSFRRLTSTLAPRWEFNFGVGIGATQATDHLIVKCIVGRRFTWPHKSAKLKTIQP